MKQVFTSLRDVLLFPPSCVGCGRTSPDSEIVIRKADTMYYGLRNLFARMTLSPSEDYRIPACDRCAGRFRWRKRIKAWATVAVAVLVFWVMVAPHMSGLGSSKGYWTRKGWVVAAALAVVVFIETAGYLLKTHSPVSARKFGDSLRFRFENDAYGCSFASQNASAVIRDSA
jgi:hypothetical protein